MEEFVMCALGRYRKLPRGILKSYPNLFSEFQAGKRSCLKKQKQNITKQQLGKLCLRKDSQVCPLAFKCTCIYMHEHQHTHNQHKGNKAGQSWSLCNDRTEKRKRSYEIMKRVGWHAWMMQEGATCQGKSGGSRIWKS